MSLVTGEESVSYKLLNIIHGGKYFECKLCFNFRFCLLPCTSSSHDESPFGILMKSDLIHNEAVVIIGRHEDEWNYLD
jgi:hypothetical protein